MCCCACIEYEKGKMTKEEFDRAMSELIYSDSTEEELVHAMKALQKVRQEKK